MQASGSSLGPYLRAEREQQGIGLTEIASLTKIQPKFIEAIEEDDYDQLPKGPFVVGFLRSYAQCLSLDAEEVVAFFQAHHDKQITGSPGQQRTPPKPQSAAPATARQRAVMIGVGLAVLVGILFFVLQSGPSEQPTAHDREAETTAALRPAARQIISAPAPPPPSIPAPTTPSDLEPHPTPDPAVVAAPPTDTAPPETPATAPSEEPALPPPPLVLRVQALEETWMRLDIDEGDRQEALIKAGQSKEWQAKEQFSLTLGNVKGARVLLNDQELDLPATRSNVLRDYVLTRALLNPRRTD